jgi:CDP-glucose 4,6-dehydratase
VGPVSAREIPPTFWSGKNVLVTGATGMVGSWLCRRLVDAGARVVALVRDADPQSELLRSGTIERVAVINGCLEHYPDVERAVNEGETDTVFHLGAQTIVGTARRSPLPTLAANVMGTAHVLEAARVHAGLVERVVVASSDKAYGAQETLPYIEGTALTGRDPYEVSKSAGDLVAQAYHATYGVPVAIARCGNIYGGGDLNWSRIVPGSIRALLRCEPLVIRSDGMFLRDYIFVEDVVDAYLALGEAITARGMGGEAFNFSNEAPMTVLAMYEAVVQALGAEYVEPVILNQADGEIRDQYLDSTKAHQRLGWAPRHQLQDGLQLTVGWYTSLLGSHGGARRQAIDFTALAS